MSDRRNGPAAASVFPPLGGPLPLRENFRWTFFGNVLYSFTQWGVLATLAKLGSSEMVGTFSLGLAVATPVLMFAGMQLRVILATGAAESVSFGGFLGFRMVTSTCALLVIAGATVIAGYPSEILGVLWIVGLAKAVESMTDVPFGLLQKNERMDRIAISKMVKGSFSLLAVGVILWFSGSLFQAVLGLTLVWFLVFISYDLRNARRFSATTPHFDLREATLLVRLALPLGIVMMLLSLNASIPQYFIQHHYGEGALGHYAAMAYLLAAGGVVVSALGQSATPTLAKHFAAGDKGRFRRLLVRLAVFASGLGLAGFFLAILAGAPILSILYRPEYAEQSHVLVWLMVGGGIGYVANVLGYGMSAAHHFRVQILVFLAVASAMLIACSVLVPSFGLLGAAYAFAISSGVNLLGSAIVLRHALRPLSTGVG